MYCHNELVCDICQYLMLQRTSAWCMPIGIVVERYKDMQGVRVWILSRGAFFRSCADWYSVGTTMGRAADDG